MEQNKATKKLQPSTNQIQISSKKDTGFYVFLSKIFLMDYKDIELHALGDAITTCVKAADLLCRTGYTEINRVETKTVLPEEGETPGQTPEGGERSQFRRGKKAKIIIKLRQSAKFPELIKNFKVQK